MQRSSDLGRGAASAHCATAAAAPAGATTATEAPRAASFNDLPPEIQARIATLVRRRGERSMLRAAGCDARAAIDAGGGAAAGERCHWHGQPAWRGLMMKAALQLAQAHGGGLTDAQVAAAVNGGGFTDAQFAAAVNSQLGAAAALGGCEVTAAEVRPIADSVRWAVRRELDRYEGWLQFEAEMRAAAERRAAAELWTAAEARAVAAAERLTAAGVGAAAPPPVLLAHVLWDAVEFYLVCIFDWLSERLLNILKR